MRALQPPGWARPRGYANGMAADAGGTLVFTAGQIGWDADGSFPSSDLAGQVRTTLENVVAVLREAGARPEHVVRLTWYVVDREEYLSSTREIGAAYRAVMGDHYPAMAVVAVAGLLESEARVEIEATAVVPASG